MSVDDIVQRIQRHGQGTLLAKLDLADAFHHILVRPEDWELLGFSWCGKDDNDKPAQMFYFSTVLPFGLGSSPKLFTDFAHATQLIMLSRGVSEVEHYLDDYITLGPPGQPACQKNLDLMLDVCRDVGFAVNPAKVVQPSTVIEFLGIILDTNLMEMRISEDRLSGILDELQLWHGRTRARKREILSLIGKLIFISRVVHCGRTFVRRMIDLCKKVKHLHHTIKLNKAFQADVSWWLTFLPTWNGVGMFYDRQWTSDIDLELYTDASDKAVSGFFAGAWFVEQVMDTTRSINWRELYAVVLAASTWGPLFAGKKILFHCDNQCVVHLLRNGTSKSPELMTLVRALFYIAATYQFDFSAEYIHTKSNTVADALSRLDFHRFWTLEPEADIVMTTPAKLVLIND